MSQKRRRKEERGHLKKVEFSFILIKVDWTSDQKFTMLNLYFTQVSVPPQDFRWAFEVFLNCLSSYGSILERSLIKNSQNIRPLLQPKTILIHTKQTVLSNFNHVPFIIAPQIHKSSTNWLLLMIIPSFKLRQSTYDLFLGVQQAQMAYLVFINVMRITSCFLLPYHFLIDLKNI